MTINSKIRLNSIEAYDPAGPVVVSYGASIPSGQTLTAQGNVNIAGVITASNFVGDGSGLTDLSVADESTVIAFTLIT